MKTWNFTVELPINVTETDIEDIITTAVEGGINYWGSVVKEGKSDKPISEIAAKTLISGGEVTIIDDDDLLYELTIAKLMHGIKKWIDSGIANTALCLDGQSLETSYIDANEADVIIQYALFDEIVYS